MPILSVDEQDRKLRAECPQFKLVATSGGWEFGKVSYDRYARPIAFASCTSHAVITMVGPLPIHLSASPSLTRRSAPIRAARVSRRRLPTVTATRRPFRLFAYSIRNCTNGRGTNTL